MNQITVNGTPRSVDPQTTVSDVVSDVTGQDPDSDQLGVAVALDSGIVPRSRWASTVTPDGAQVEIITAMQGG
ncbi:MAG: sulfur carrier protein ThiS [Corynebacterium sp.]|uniref:sulfur carrier protein ThiS n=1 Tax=unclassified Corynebacterium TaxID=2624378 RepID=UPI0026488BF7|nr:sulfur carrier protein ThiS [Corynebacterium sp.]MDN5581418.1 sulfur carrier protein ThiS [Corynebacterium sp.]MDN5721245.1 sulfur carrier protein ThiS [Corynebacterium sp.]MDN6386778.1 sulfur carrier protein ThiS [Corynebacterium sp.]